MHHPPVAILCLKTKRAQYEYVSGTIQSTYESATWHPHYVSANTINQTTLKTCCMMMSHITAAWSNPAAPPPSFFPPPVRCASSATPSSSSTRLARATQPFQTRRRCCRMRTAPTAAARLCCAWQGCACRTRWRCFPRFGCLVGLTMKRGVGSRSACCCGIGGSGTCRIETILHSY